ncbi:ATP-binding protein [Thaumasiovibrio sp. DFM-14]|uniref:hybrid sensor histidine kinase/response regulator n=1 Tax=Thaumasiovibrio sp. DFM-14 TaxID=3384792 RepID=UPI0039A299C5
MDTYFNSEKLQETLVELHRSQQREKRLKDENTAILAGIAAMAEANDKLQVFNSLLEVIGRYVNFETALVLSRESGFQTFSELVSTNAVFSDIEWRAGELFDRATNGASIALYNPALTSEFSVLPAHLQSYVSSALLTGVTVSSGDAVLIFAHSKPNAFTAGCRKVIERFRPLLERTIIDIDYRERLQALVTARTQELIKSRLRFKDFARTAGDWFWEVDTNYSFTYLSTPNVETRRVSNTGLFDIISGENKKRALQAILASVSAFDEFECQLVQDDGSRWFALSGKPFYDSNGYLLGFRGIAKDITSRRQHIEEITKARLQADLANNAKSQFLAMMSHEIRTPLNGVMGLMDVLMDSTLTNEQTSWLKQMDQSAHLLLNIINDILDLSKIEAGNIEIYLEPMNLRECISFISGHLKPQAEKKGLIFDVFVSDDTPDWIVGDKNRFSQILFNLVGNAIKFTEQGHISVNVTAELDELNITISDTGIGIAEESQQHLFNPFVQADGSITRKYGGTGLGLAISQLLIEKLNGCIELQSKLGVGSRFTITMPIERCSSPCAVIEAQQLKQKASLSVLVVEDSKANQMIAKLMLQKQGHKVEVAEHGEKAVEMVLQQNKNFDVILMDVSMPVMDGYQATTLLRQGGITTPIIATTANVMESDRAACIECGMTDFLAKPIRASAMSQMLQKYQTPTKQ